MFSDGPGTARRRPGTGGGRGDRQPYDEPLSTLREHAENLAAWTAVWEARAEPEAHARRCASDAVDAIDAMLRDLYLIRGQLTAEVRQADDATAARADALPTRVREDGER